jgi:hypothetical protein
MKSLVRALLAAVLLTGATPAASQAVSPTAAQAPAARPADVASTGSITAALYDVISGPAGQKRDWNRLRSLFRPEARFVPVVARKDGGFETRVLTVEDYIARSGPRLEAEGFIERETSHREERYGNIAHVWSGYEARAGEGGPVIARGVNSIQLMYDGARWWVLNLAWDQERPPTSG